MRDTEKKLGERIDELEKRMAIVEEGVRKARLIQMLENTPKNGGPPVDREPNATPAPPPKPFSPPASGAKKGGL